MLYDQNLEYAAQREYAKQILDKYKEVENKTTFHSMRLNKNTVVYCKNEDQLEKYQRKEKETIVCRTEN